MFRKYMMDSVTYWAKEYHIDGFRFDLASILGRDKNGNLTNNPPVLERIAEDPVLRNTKIIAEAWDAGGAYQVGSFPGGRWAEWNDRFRDDCRRFWRGDDNMAADAATRIGGSADLYGDDGRKPYHSINFVTSHDGFTMNDLVSYNGKHNEENGENNRDGSDNNCSFNYGYEGPTQNRAIEKVRNQQIKNFLCSLIFSQGTPMLLAGDEIRRSQRGNNNAYCQDNELSWLDWTCLEIHKEILLFTQKALQVRRAHPVFRRLEFFEGKRHGGPASSLPDVSWFGPDGRDPDWEKANHFLAYRLGGGKLETGAEEDDWDFFVMCNSATNDITVTLPPPARGKKWHGLIDTSASSPDDFIPEDQLEPLEVQKTYVLPARTTAILVGK